MRDYILRINHFSHYVKFEYQDDNYNWFLTSL